MSFKTCLFNISFIKKILFALNELYQSFKFTKKRISSDSKGFTNLYENINHKTLLNIYYL